MDEAILTRMDRVIARPVSWLWPGRIPLGKLTILAGDPGLGKSYITTWLAARVTRCDAFPDGKNGLRMPGDVLMLSAEDDLEDTICPRLKQHEAYTKRVHIIEGIRRQGDRRTTGLDLDRHMDQVDKTLGQLERPRLLIVDPITAYMGKTDANSNAEVRGLLRDLAELGSRHNVAVVCVTHLNKGSANAGKAMYRTIGSLAFTAAARMVYSVTKGLGDSDERLVLPVKCNLEHTRLGMSYTITDKGLEWTSMEVDQSADEAEDAQRVDERSMFDDAKAFLRDQLAGGPVPASKLFPEADLAGVTARTLRRAKKALGVVARQVWTGDASQWAWSLPGPVSAPHPRSDGHGHLGRSASTPTHTVPSSDN